MVPDKLHIKPNVLSKATKFLQGYGPKYPNGKYMTVTQDYTNSKGRYSLSNSTNENRAQEIQSLFEEIYGKLAVAYHRTNQEGMKHLMRGQVFREPTSGLYGPGVYLTYDLASQLNDQMINTYGPYIIKARVNLDKFLILDEPVARRVYPGLRNYIVDQLENVFRLPPERWNQALGERGARAISMLEMTSTRPEYTSDVAHILVTSSLPWLRRNTRGLIFTGRNDGRVVVAFDERSVTPMSYVLNKTNSRAMNWKPVKEFARETFNQPLIPGLRVGNPERELRLAVNEFKKTVGMAFHITSGAFVLTEGNRATELSIGLNLAVPGYRQDDLSARISSLIESALHTVFMGYKYLPTNTNITRTGPLSYQYSTTMETAPGVLRDAPRNSITGRKSINIKI